MIFYNTTFHHDRAITTELSEWIRTSFLPDALEFGFSEPLFTRVIMPESDESIEAYALGLKCDDLEFVSKWESSQGAAMLSELFDRWGERALAFSTPMEIVDL